jgi:hypothetical protein
MSVSIAKKCFYCEKPSVQDINCDKYTVKVCLSIKCVLKVSEERDWHKIEGL